MDTRYLVSLQTILERMASAMESIKEELVSINEQLMDRDNKYVIPQARDGEPLFGDGTEKNLYCGCNECFYRDTVAKTEPDGSNREGS